MRINNSVLYIIVYEESYISCCSGAYAGIGRL